MALAVATVAIADSIASLVDKDIRKCGTFWHSQVPWGTWLAPTYETSEPSETCETSEPSENSSLVKIVNLLKKGTQQNKWA